MFTKMYVCQDIRCFENTEYVVGKYLQVICLALTCGYIYKAPGDEARLHSIQVYSEFYLQRRRPGPPRPSCPFFLGTHYSYSMYLDYDERLHLLVGYLASGPVSAPHPLITTYILKLTRDCDNQTS